MNQNLRTALGLWNRWMALGLPAKLAIAIGTAATLSFGGLMWWAQQPEYRVLYSNLSGAESSTITARLKAKGIPFHMDMSGATILVPVEHLGQVHVDLTADGVAGSKFGKGWELYDQQSMIGSTPMTQRVNYLRAQQTELTRTIMHVVPIVSARVHIVQPDGNSPFLRDKKPTTASILVTLRPGATLRPETVAGLVSLASGSVEGLMPENVRILDASGRLLSEQHDPDSRWPTSFLNQRKEVEHYLSRAAERMLESVLGVGRAIVHVNAEISNKMLDETKEIISPEGKLIIQEKNTLDKVTPGAAAKGGPVGTASNTAKGGSTTSTGGGNSVKETQESTYKYPTVIQKWQSKHGAIERLSVAVLVDTTANPELTVASVEDLVKQAVGFTTGRDQIKVSPVKIATTPPPEPVDVDQHSLQRWQTVLSIVRYVSIGMVALCAFPILWVLFRRRIPPPGSVAAESDQEKLKIITRELERNPEALAAILASWIDKSDAVETKRAA